MAVMQNCIMSERQVEEAFLASPPLISQQIKDLTVKSPSWLRDLPETNEWPLGMGTVMQELVFRGQMPRIERGLGNWVGMRNNSGCDPCAGPDCAYNWTEFGGTAMERKAITLLKREFKSPSYCVKEIQSTYEYKAVFAQIVKNLFAQVDFFREQNIVFNILTGFAKKYVVDSSQPQPNPANPYVYRNIGTTRLSKLNIVMLEWFYEYMRRLPDAVPYDVVDGSPIFSMIASHQLLADLYRSDPNLRQDVRFSGLANDMLMKYNFMSTIQGMFIAAPILYPRRFMIVAGEPVEILPFINDVPSDIGVYTDLNPAYEYQATHEEIILHGKSPFKLFRQPTVETLGANTSFGPEPEVMEDWKWINPLTVQDPFRRVGFFASAATLGVSPQHSQAIFSILVERPKLDLIASFYPEPTCPPEEVECDNTVPDTGCPCPQILQAYESPVTPGLWTLVFAAPIDAEADDEIQLGVDSGGYLVGTIETISADGTAATVTFPDGTTIPDCNIFTSIFCTDTRSCFAQVLSYAVNCTDATRIDMYLSSPLKATVGDDITLTLGDGTTVDVEIISEDLAQNLYTVDVGASNFCNQVGGIYSACVPTAVDATCPGCGGVTFTQCS